MEQQNALRQTMRDVASEYENALARPDFGKALDVLNRGLVGGTVGQFADIGNQLLDSLSFGLIPKQEKPFMGSEWLGDRMQDMGMVSANRYPIEELLAGLVDPVSALSALKGLPLAAHIVYHGSPHTFDAFDASKIGTGEGAQAYGHGVYLAEKPSTAEYYQQGLGGFTYKGEPVTRDAINSVPTNVYDFNKKTGGDINDFTRWLDSEDGINEIARATMYDALTSYSDIGSARSVLSEKAKRIPGSSQYSDALKLLDESVLKGELVPSGNLYKADIPDEWLPRMLDWDKPLSEQSDAVRAALSAHDKDWGRYINGERLPDFVSSFIPQSGKGAYDSISTNIGSRKRTSDSFGSDFDTSIGRSSAAEYLSSLGIPGIRYLDGSSRGNGQGTYNYVIFPGMEDQVKILERNGVPIR